MKVLIVWANKDAFGFLPVNISLLSALLKAGGHEVDLFDTAFIDFGYERSYEIGTRIRVFKPVDYAGHDVSTKKVDLATELGRKLDDFKPDILAVSTLDDGVKISRAISAIAKQWRRDIVVLWGNKAPTMSPESVLQDENVDFLCRGEGIEFITEFMNALEAGGDIRKIKNLVYRDEDGRVQMNELRPFYQDLDRLPFQDWSLFDQRQFLKPFQGKMYRGGDYMMSWGCPNSCTYCANTSYRELYGRDAGRFIRSYGVPRIIEELEFLQRKWGIERFKFHDDDFCMKPLSYFRRLAAEYRDRVDVPFSALTNARSVTPEKVKLLKSMNCVHMAVAIEAGNEEYRKKILKRKESRDEIVNAFRLLNDAGILTTSYNMMGLPFENREMIMETVEMNRQSGVRYPGVAFFRPFPGTELRDISVDNGFFDPNGELEFDNTRPSLNLPDISAAELIAIRERFHLYVKMPAQFHEYIQRSEQPDDLGKALTAELYLIYEECVFPNDGVWEDHGRSGEMIDELTRLCAVFRENLGSSFAGLPSCDGDHKPLASQPPSTYIS